MTINDVASCRNVLRASNASNAAGSVDRRHSPPTARSSPSKPEALKMLLSGVDLKDGMQRA